MIKGVEITKGMHSKHLHETAGALILNGHSYILTVLERFGLQKCFTESKVKTNFVMTCTISSNYL